MKKKITDLPCAVTILVFEYIVQNEIKFWIQTMDTTTSITGATKDQTHPYKTAIFFKPQ